MLRQFEILSVLSFEGKPLKKMQFSVRLLMAPSANWSDSVDTQESNLKEAL